MGKVWVLDTETKGTGAQMLPLEKVQKQPAPKPRRRRAPAPQREREALEPRRPERFKIVDVTIHAWDEDSGHWQRLSRGEERALWRLRGR